MSPEIWSPLLTRQNGKDVASFLHASGAFGVVFPFLVWVFLRKGYPLVNTQGIEALNFHIQAALLEIVMAVVTLLWLGPLVPPVFYAYRGLMALWASINVWNNPEFRYPFVFTRWLPNLTTAS